MKMKQSALSILALSIITASTSVIAQENDALTRQAQDVIASAQPVHLQATIVGIDKRNRMVTVRGPHRDVSVVVSHDVTNFDQLRVGDKVDVEYKNALLVTAEKVTGKDAGIRKREDTQTVAPASGPGGESGFASARQVEVVATVEHVDTKHHTITLCGPWRTETMDLLPQYEDQKFKKGDTVHAVFVSVAAVKVTPVASK
ncbi:putative exported protein [Candidatus Burkholderia humilis]|nr:putative exported protein [Candidatus Burkholderia humilis]